MNPYFFLVTIFVVNAFCELRAQNKIPISSRDPAAIILYKKGLKAADVDEVSKARQFFSEAVEKDTCFALAYMQLALLQEQFSLRTAYMQKAMKHSDKVSEGERIWILGRNAFYGDGKREDEFGYFEKLVNLYPEDAIAQYLYGYMNHHHGRSNYAKAIEHLEKSVRLAPTYITALDDLAVAYMEIRDFKNAERILLREISLQPNKAKPKDTYGEMLLRSGQYEKSIAVYKEALKIDPYYPWSVFGVAANLNFLGKYQQARYFLSTLSNVKLSERDSYHLMYAYECSYLDEGQPDSAIFILRQHEAMAKEKNLFTQRFMALSHVCRIFFEYGDTVRGKHAYDEFNQMIQNETQNTELKKQIASLGDFYAAYSFYIGGQTGLARTTLENYNKKRGRADDQSKMLLAKISLMENNIPGAEALIKQCNPENPYVQYWLGMVYLKGTNNQEAMKLFIKIAERNEMHDLDYHLVRRKAISQL